MKYVLAYVVTFLLAIVAFLLLVWLTIATVALIAMFITWSVPSTIVITGTIFRISIAIAAVAAAAFIASNDGKDVVEGFVNGYDRTTT
jgi:hypothetical protein